jgi:hypothetical protein
MKKIIFALFPFALLFGKTEIRLQTIDYEPFVEEMVSEIELEDGEIVGQTINGKEATEEDFEKLAEKTGEQIGFETEIVSFQQNAIAEYVGAFLKSKGIEYENHGTKLVVEKLEPEIIAEITRKFSFVESIEKVEEAIPTEYLTMDDALETISENNIKPYGFWKHPLVESKNTVTNDIGIMLMEADSSCPRYIKNMPKNNNGDYYVDTSRMRVSGHINSFDTYNGHASKVAHILQKSSPHTYIHCMQRNFGIKPKNFTPNIYISNHSYGWFEDDYASYDRDLDNFIFNTKIASFVSSGNPAPSDNPNKYVKSPGKALNAITVGNYSADLYNGKGTQSKAFNYLIYKNPKSGFDKPEFVANGFIDFEGGKYFEERIGSSYSTPFLASGFGANLLGQFSFFKYRPYLLKAFLLAISQNLIESKKTVGGYSPIGDKDGAGTPNYKNINGASLLYITSSNLSGAFNAGYKNLRKFNFVKGKKYRIAISWLTHGDYTFDEKKPYVNFDLYLRRGIKAIASSKSLKNNFEVIEFAPDEYAEGEYTIEVRKASLDDKHKDYKNTLFLGLAIAEIKE